MKLIVGLQMSTVLLLLGLSACDPSKPELDKTKQQLKEVTADRDSLKAQLETADTKIATCNQQVSALQAAAAKPPEPKPAEKPAATKAGKKKPAAKHKKHH